MTILGLISAVVVGVSAGARSAAARATSLRTRSFVVLVVAMVIPSLRWPAWQPMHRCGCGMGPGAALEQAHTRRRKSWRRVHSLDGHARRRTPGGSGPADSRHRRRYAAGNTGGAWLSTMADVKSLGCCPVGQIGSPPAYLGYAVAHGRRRTARLDARTSFRVRTGPERDVTSRVGRRCRRRSTAASPSIVLLGEFAVLAANGRAHFRLSRPAGAWLLSRGVVLPVRRLAEASGRSRCEA